MGTNSILTNRNLRREIVQRINKLVDIPYLNERHEAHLIAIVVDMCFNALAGKTMPSTKKQRGIEEQDGEDEEVEIKIPEGDLESAKEQMIREINEKFDLPLLNEKQEAMLIKYFVDIFFQVKVDAEGTK